MEIKTTDGHEAKNSSYYYLEDGQVVILNDTAVTANGEARYLVTPFYEGTAMDCKLYPSGHTEIETNWEHEGLEIMVKSLFLDEPMEKLGERHKIAIESLEAVSISYGKLKKDTASATKDLKQIVDDIETVKKANKSYYENNEELRKEQESLNNDISAARQRLSELEDSESDYVEMKSDIAQIAKADLLQLRKTEFKMQCLEAGGIDNWEWFEESLKDYDNRYPE